MPSISESRPQTNLLQPNLSSIDNNSNSNSNNSNSNNDADRISQTRVGVLIQTAKDAAHSLKVSTTYIGSFVYLLYHVVFCLALGSAIMRPNNSVSILGLMTKTAALGTLVASPIYWIKLSKDFPALYPTADLFLAPFLAKLAAIVDQALADDPAVSEEENDAVFLASFGVLTAIGMIMSACLILAASVFKLANLGSYLPFPVICGFFSAVGILTWTLAINVDTGGKTIGAILTSGDLQLVRYALIHHIPTLIVAGFMKYLGPKNPFFVCLVVVVTIALFYVFMLATGTTLLEMKQEGWFWAHEELVYENYASTLGFDVWAPPAPFAVWVVSNQVHWGAVRDGISTVVALSFLYLIRCSVHGAALKKNVGNFSRKALRGNPKENRTAAALSENESGDENNGISKIIPKPPSIKSRKFSEAVDIEAVMSLQTAQGNAKNGNGNDGEEAEDTKDHFVRAKSTNISLKTVSLAYGLSQVFNAVAGGFAITPSVASSSTMFMLGAENLAPQVGSVLLLLIFYLTDFQIVGYIPKPAFSSMLVLSFFDMTYTWFFKSFKKTKDKLEWIVVPAIVVCAFALDLLSAVFLGIAFSTFIFVGAFFRSGVVKYVANGKSINSTIERPNSIMSQWLNDNGDRIQVICLQNYLFFGNASSIYNYVFELFESNGANEVSFVKSKSRFLILDLTLVTGMDTSTVDVFSQIKSLCEGSNCKLFMTGMSKNIRSILALGGFTPDTGVRSKRQVRFFARLDAALGKAEDILLESDYVDQLDQVQAHSMRRLARRKESGFQTALRYIDTEHGDNFFCELAGLEKYTTMLELQPGEVLYKDGSSKDIERGLFFIEAGVLKEERDTGDTATRRGCDLMTVSSSMGGSGDTLTRIQECSLAISSKNAAEHPTFRLARLGVGWVAGTMEFFQMKRPGNQVALDHCKLHHLPFSKIQEAELDDPVLVLKLYKLLSYLMARRQEATIGQLATLHSIMSSPAR
eukprot:jgi/Psemu1/262507/estExt_Genewise1Plus.C_7830008